MIMFLFFFFQIPLSSSTPAALHGNRGGSARALTRKQISLVLFFFSSPRCFSHPQEPRPLAGVTNCVSEQSSLIHTPPPHTHPSHKTHTHTQHLFSTPSAQTSPLCERLYKGCHSVPLLPGEGAHAAADSPALGNPPSQRLVKRTERRLTYLSAAFMVLDCVELILNTF